MSEELARYWGRSIGSARSRSRTTAPGLRRSVLEVLGEGARPTSWSNDVYVNAASGGSRTMETLADVDRSANSSAGLHVGATCDGKQTGLDVHVLRLDGARWRVSGYSVDSKLLLGVALPGEG